VTAKKLVFAVNPTKVLRLDWALIVLDAVLASREQVGTVQAVRGGLDSGSAANKNLPKVGDVTFWV